MIGIVLKSEESFKSLQLVRIQCPLSDHNSSKNNNSLDEESASIFKVAQEDFDLRNVLRNIEALNSGEHRFVALPNGPALIQLVCPKAIVAKLFKALFAQQRTLGIRLTDLKSHVILSPMNPEEVLQACSADILSSLENISGWHPIHRPSADQTGTLLLGVNPMENADGKPQITPLLDIEIEISGNDTVILLLKPSAVRFRHSAIAAFSNPTTTTNTSLAEASKAAEGSLCRVLPTLTPAIIHKLRIASSKEAQAIETEWARAGFTLPPSDANTRDSATYQHVVDVRFEEDEDAPTTPLPACAVLSYLGFDPVDTKLNSPGVLGALHRLQDDLKHAEYKLFGSSSGGSGGLVIKEVRKWNDTPSYLKGGKAYAPATRGFQSAAEMDSAGAATAAASSSGPPVGVDKLGEVIDLASMQTGVDNNNHSGQATAVRNKRPHARAGPEVLSYLARLEKEEAAATAAAAAANPQRRKTALPPSMALAAQASKVVKKVPLLGSAKRALPTAAEKVTKAPKKTAAGAAAGSKPAAPKVPKPVVEIDVASLDVHGLAATGKLATLTIPQLKAYCRSIKQPVGGKKSDLESRIKTHLGILLEQ